MDYWVLNCRNASLNSGTGQKRSLSFARFRRAGSAAGRGIALLQLVQLSVAPAVRAEGGLEATVGAFT